MCGRYALAQDHEALKIRFGFESESSVVLSPSYNIAPSQKSPVITKNESKELHFMKWGLIPHWAKDASIGFKLINARSETVAEKPSFRDAFKKKRCLIPATGFYEWQKQEDSKIKLPFYIHTSDNNIFSLAGLWSLWKDPDGGEFHTYTILTTEPNKLMEPIHKRMPVILRTEDEDKWLDESADKSSLQNLFDPYPANLMTAHPVSTFVNSPVNNTADCIAEV